MQSPPPPFHLTSDDVPAAWPLHPPTGPAAARTRRRVTPRAMFVIAVAAGAVFGVMLGGRISTEDGLTAARDALASGDAARAVTLDDDIAARGGFLLLLDPGAASRAGADAEAARLAWARQLAAAGDIDGAVRALDAIGSPALAAEAATARTTILSDAAGDALKAGLPLVALQRYEQALADHPPLAMVGRLTADRAAAEVPAAASLLERGSAVDAVALLDDATKTGAAAAAAARPYYPTALLAAARAQLAAEAGQEANATLQRLVAMSPYSPEGQSARQLLRAPQPVSGTLVDGAGHPAAGRVRLGSHYSTVFGGYQTSGPYYYGTADANGDFTITGVPVGGPYVLEYYRSGGWQTLVDPRTDQPANPVTVNAVTPVDLTFIVLPG